MHIYGMYSEKLGIYKQVPQIYPNKTPNLKEAFALLTYTLPRKAKKQLKDA